MARVQMKRFILYRQRSVLSNVADIKHFGGGGEWKSVFHKSHRPLYIVLSTHVEKWAAYIILDMGQVDGRGTCGAYCRKSFKELGTLFSINMYSFTICHSYVSYNHKLFCLVSWSPFFFFNVKSKMKGLYTWHKIKLEIEAAPPAWSAPSARRLKTQW